MSPEGPTGSGASTPRPWVPFCGPPISRRWGPGLVAESVFIRRRGGPDRGFCENQTIPPQAFDFIQYFFNRPLSRNRRWTHPHKQPTVAQTRLGGGSTNPPRPARGNLKSPNLGQIRLFPLGPRTTPTATVWVPLRRHGRGNPVFPHIDSDRGAVLGLQAPHRGNQWRSIFLKNHPNLSSLGPGAFFYGAM